MIFQIDADIIGAYRSGLMGNGYTEDADRIKKRTVSILFRLP